MSSSNLQALEQSGSYYMNDYKKHLQDHQVKLDTRSLKDDSFKKVPLISGHLGSGSQSLSGRATSLHKNEAGAYDLATDVLAKPSEPGQ